MQIISMTVEYALVAMIYMALRSKFPDRKQNAVITVEEISNATGISMSFLSKIMLQLYRANLLRSSRGRNGGYMLVKPPENISCYEVIEAVDGPLRMNLCQVDPEECPATYSCPFYGMWCELQENLENTLKKYSLHSIAVSIQGLDTEPAYLESIKKRFKHNNLAKTA